MNLILQIYKKGENIPNFQHKIQVSPKIQVKRDVFHYRFSAFTPQKTEKIC